MFIKKLKKTISLIVASAMLLSCAACGKESGFNQTSNTTEDNGPSTQQTTEPADIEDDLNTGDTGDAEIQEAFETYLDDYFYEYVTSDTISYHYTISNPDSFGIEPPEATLGDTDMSEEALEKEAEEYQAQIDELIAIDRDGLDEEQQFTYDVLLAYLENEMKIYDNVYLYEPFSPMSGLQSNISTVFTDYAFNSEQDIQDYISLLNQVRDYFGAYLEFERLKSENGYFMADETADSVIEQCETFIENTDDHFMIELFNSRVDELDFLSDEAKEDYKEQNRDAVLNSLIPAFQDTIDTFNELKGTGTNDGGVCNYEGGSDYYEYLLAKRIGTSKSPEELIEMLDARYNEILMEMYYIMMGNEAAYTYYVENYDNLYPELENMTPEEIISEVKEATENYYPETDDIPYTIDYLDESLETIMENTLAYYLSPAIDNPDNNVMKINGSHGTSGLWQTLAHEGFPGHMYQNVYYLSTDPEPVRCILSFTGYSEAWAVYVGYDAVKKYDFPDADETIREDVAQLAALDSEFSYLIMARIDLGINYEGWTLEDTENYMTGLGLNAASAEEMYYVFVGDPAVYQSYSTAYYELLELKEYAEDELGDDFDVVEFEDAVLKAGPCQFSLLKEKIDEYIEDTK